MTRTKKFVDAFWGIDFCATTGLDTLAKRMKEGRETCKEVHEFLDKRAKIEDEYSRKLLTLVKGIGNNSEIGTLRTAWECVKVETEQLGNEHADASKGFADSAIRLKDFMEKQKSQRTVTEETVRRSVRRKIDCYKKVTDTKKQYDNANRECEKWQSQYAVAKCSGAAYPQKDWDKLYKVQEKLQKDEHSTDSAYRASVEALESARKDWEKDMTHMCNRCDQLEEDRVGFLRNEMWIAANIVSMACVNDDKHCEEIRLSLEKCDIDADLELFIRTRSTGYEKPAPIVYQQYSSHANPPETRQEPHPTRTLPPPRPRQPLPPNHPVVDSATARGYQTGYRPPFPSR